MMLSPTRFRFLNEERTICARADWNSADISKLWLYNLHYFDDLNAEDASFRRDWHRALIARWLAENPPGAGVGWAPYPLSLRIVNWIKWSLAGKDPDAAVRQSLAIQVRHLTGRLEYHLLGNHLFMNAKALVFAGCYFDGDEAAIWLRLGMDILEREIPEQILADGGQFERSTMYHALAYEDMLDLANLAQLFPDTFAPWSTWVATWPEIIRRMGGWLRAMCHPDGEIAFFNDAGIGIAPAPDALFAYARRLDMAAPELSDRVVRLDPSGYVRVCAGDAVLLIDAAPVGPDYLPGHAHADTLSYELSLFGQRIVVNSGTSRYGLGPEREWERSTAAHTTVEIDGQSSSEVWAGFRVARRAYPFDVSVRQVGSRVVVDAAHDGYRRLPGHPIHRRRWVLEDGRIEVVDFIEGRFSEAISRIHFHPDVHLKKIGSGGSAQWSGHEILWDTNVTDSAVEPAYWHPGFGVSVPNSVLRMTMASIRQTSSCCFTLGWA